VLRAFGFRQVQRFNMNEGHSSLLVLELLDERLANHKRRSIDSEDIEAVSPQSIFASHTPVPAGHEQFPMDLAERVLGRWQDIIEDPEVAVNQTVSRTLQRKVGLYDTDLLPLVTETLVLTYLALHVSHYVQGVDKRHAEISSLVFEPFQIEHITNGVHAATWVCPEFQELFDSRISGWRADNFSLRYALGVPPLEIWSAHMKAKRSLIELVNDRANTAMEM